MINKNYIIFFLLFFSVTFAQKSDFIKPGNTHKNIQSEEIIFREIESGIKAAEVKNISKYFGAQTYFSFSNGINGYYSTNQAYYVLEDFFNLYKVTSFKFDHIKIDKNISYATGKYNFDNKGQRSTAQVYISIKKVGTSWQITQFTIN